MAEEIDSLPARLDELRQRQQSAWRAGKPLPVEALIKDAVPALTDSELVELIYGEVLLRAERGETFPKAECLQRFPQVADALRKLFEIHLAQDHSNTETPGHSARTAGPGSLADGEETFVPADIPSTIDGPADPSSIVRTIGRYAVERILGQGAFGTVFLCRDPDLDRQVAIKLPRHDRFRSADAAQAFMDEARTVARLRHPRIVSVFDVGRTDEGTPFVVLQYIDGPSLHAAIGSQQVSPRRAAEILALVADAVAYAHKQGFIHRDLKPANILLDAQGTPHVSDFGLALHESQQAERKGEYAGTAAYMSPEQVRGEVHRLDGRADVWALGVILYHLLTRRLPFHGTSLEQIADEIQHRDPKPPRQVDETIPVELERIIHRCCQKKSVDRYSTASDLAADLRAWLDGKAPPAISWRTILVGAVGILLLAGLIGWAGNLARSTLWQASPGSNATNVDPSAVGSPTPDASEPLRVTAIEVNHFATTPAGGVPRGLLGQNSFTPVLGDKVQVRAKLSRAAYAYLIAFRPDGVADLCFPESEDVAPPLTDAPRYPLANGLKAYGLREGTGLWVFAVVASEKPLPTYRIWLRERFPEKSAWEPLATLPSGVVWWDDGATHIDHFTAAGLTHAVRGKDETLDGPAAAIKRLTDSLRSNGPMDTASAIGFAVSPTH